MPDIEYSYPRQGRSYAEPTGRNAAGKGCCRGTNGINFLKKILEATEKARPLRSFSLRPYQSNSEPRLVRHTKACRSEAGKTLFDGVAP